jgi:hypothetical protein
MDRGFTLHRDADHTTALTGVTDAILASGGARIGVAGLVPELGRRARRQRLLPRKLGNKVAHALTWEFRDRVDARWFSQGISNSLRTGLDAEVLAVAWYSKRGQGTRVSFVDLARARYEHVLLAVPQLTEDGEPAFEPLGVHAGGLVWHNRYLHVAATRQGFFTCDVDDLLRMPDQGRSDAFGHRYVLPVRYHHRADAIGDTELLRYSFLSLDRSEETPALVVGEYGSMRRTRRLARIPVDDVTGELLPTADGMARPRLLSEENPPRMQGAAVVDGTWYVTASQGHWTPGTVHVGRPGAFRSHHRATPMGPEDLVHGPGEGLLWSNSEHPWRRWIFAMRIADLPA